MKIKAQVEDDGTGVPLEKVLEFDVIIHACQISRFESLPVTLGTQEYTIGDPDVSFGYSLIQEPQCGYTIDSEIIHIDHEPLDSSFFSFDPARNPGEQFKIS